MPAMWRAAGALAAALMAACGGGDDSGIAVTFDGDGFADGEVSITVSPNFYPDLALGPDGSLYLFGHADVGHGEDATTNGRNLIIRLRPDGTPDSGFDGDAVYVQRDVRETIVDLAFRPDGHVVALTQAGPLPAIWQLDDSGALDIEFGDGGTALVEAPLGPASFASGIGMDLASDGSVVVVGHISSTLTAELGNLAARVGPDGAVLTAVDQPGLLPFDTWQDILVDGDGRAWVFGERTSGSRVVPMVGRLTDAMTRDDDFTADGYAKAGPMYSYCRGAVKLADGAFAAVGSSGIGDSFGGAVLAFTAVGDLDPTFDGDGHLPLDVPYAARPVPLSDGSLLEMLGSDPQSAYLVRITRAGIIDPTFGTDGELDVPGGGNFVVAADGSAYVAFYDWPQTVRLRRISI